MKLSKTGGIAAVALLGTVAIAGCGTVNNALSAKTSEIEYFRVYNIKTAASVNVIAHAAANGIGKDIDGMQEVYPINTSGVTPSKPGYMKLVDPFEGSPMGAFAASAGSVGFKLANCPGAAWTAKANKVVAGDDRESFDMCLFPQSGGYQLDISGDLVTETGGINLSLLIARSVVNHVMGSPKEFMDKAFADTLDSIHAAVPSAQLAFVRGEPMPGPLPWISHTVLAE